MTVSDVRSTASFVKRSPTECLSEDSYDDYRVRSMGNELLYACACERTTTQEDAVGDRTSGIGAGPGGLVRSVRYG